MLIDINAHVGHWPFKQLKYNTCALLLERMNKYGVDISVVSNLNGVFYKDTQSANEELFEELKSKKKFTNRFLPFAVINPTYGGWQNDFEICTGKFGMKGVCLYPLYHDYEITDPCCIELVKRARDKSIIVTFTHRIVDARQRSWMDISKEWTMKDIMPIIREVKDAKYFIVNAANSMNVDGTDDELLKNTDLLIDTSGRSLTNPGEMIKKLGKEKFAFGTHSPVLDYLTGLLRIESLRPDEADKATKELIRSGNAKKMLGIQ
ncbi:MAG: amidohydrolase [Bacteroidetes bacterium GWC2_40_22]|nr:MAG: amidohydrolase [Bacteroidetes bacterium GWC2_40_22]